LYDLQAKDRQRDGGKEAGRRRPKQVPANLPGPIKGDARGRILLEVGIVTADNGLREHCKAIEAPTMTACIKRGMCIALLGLACAAVATGCSPQHNETLIGPLPPTGARFKVLYPLTSPTVKSSSQAGGEHQHQYKWDCGSMNFEVAGDSLKVNGHDYGTLKGGDAVVIDGRQDAKVTVNDVERMPVKAAE
jgi:hypothetical protein